MEIKMSMIPVGKTGKVGKISVKVGDTVKNQEVLVQVETGKGNRTIKATGSGVIYKIFCEEGKEVVSNQVLFEIEELMEAITENLTEETQNESQEKQQKESQNESQKKQQNESQNDAQKNRMETDLLIIGGGPGGYVAAIYAAKNGLHVTLVEKENLGGTCLNVGCIPTKALVKSSEICHELHNATEFGIHVNGEISVDMGKVIERKDKVKSTLISGIAFLMNKNKITVISGTASFVGKNEVTVIGERSYTIVAKDIIVATGSKISKINIPGITLPFIMDSTRALSCKELPKSISIIGGGVIGMEFAFIYRNLGVEVHVIEFMDRLLTMVDRDISKEIFEIATSRGIKISLSSKVVKIQSTDDKQAVITYERGEEEFLVVSEKVLIAIGREPNMEGLSSEKAEITLNDRGRGIRVDTHMRTSTDHVYAIGDVTNIIQLAHVASHQGIMAVDNILGKDTQMEYFAVPNVIFTSPEIASVGKNEEDCKTQGIKYQVSRFDFSGNGKALTMNEPKGYIKLIKDNTTGEIIGGSIIGADASSLIASLTMAVQNHFTEKEIIHTIFAHPTTGEVIHEAAMGLGIGALHL